MDSLNRKHELELYETAKTDAAPEEQRQVLLLLIRCLLEAELGELTKH